MTVYIIVAIVALLLLFVLLTFNKLTKLKNMVKEAFSTMDVYLKKRWDLVPNLVECVKGYASHEQNTLEEIVNLRNTIYDDMSNNEKVDAGEKIKTQVSKIMMLAESYPELKADKNFRELSEQLVKIEDDIANSRKYYNGTVKNYNIAILTIPNNIVAKLFGFKEEKMFEASDNEKDNVKVEL